MDDGESTYQTRWTTLAGSILLLNLLIFAIHSLLIGFVISCIFNNSNILYVKKTK